SAGALFDKTLLYFLFYCISFIFPIYYFFKLNNLSFFTLVNLRSYLKLSFFIAALFFIFPRIPNPIPFTFNSGSEGEIGYSPDLDISSIEKLVENDTKVFWAKLKNPKNREELYWRGNVASITDGWNWASGPEDQGILEVIKERRNDFEEYRLFIKTPYLFYYDVPSIITVIHKIYRSDDTFSFNTSYVRNHSRYFVREILTTFEDISNRYLRHNLSQSTVNWINNQFPDHEIEQIVAQYRHFITEEKFQYSWAPGKIKSLDEFIEKKVGFCTHYASSLALILRAKNHPARIVSGFQGGRYNPYGNFYEISQNDAHAWVEVNIDGIWRRIDPTSFIAPERIVMDYQEVVSNNFVIPQLGTQGGLSFLSRISFIIGQWDFEFYQFMDQWDAIEQLNFFSQFKLTRKSLFLLSGLFLLALIIILIKKKDVKNPRQRLWETYLSLLKKKNVSYSGSFHQLHRDIEKEQIDQKEIYVELLDEFTQLFYNDLNNLKKIEH